MHIYIYLVSTLVNPIPSVLIRNPPGHLQTPRPSAQRLPGSVVVPRSQLHHMAAA